MLQTIMRLLSGRQPTEMMSQDAASFIRSALKDRVLAQRPVLCNLGCGTKHHPEWINIDFLGDRNAVFPWDLRLALPLPNACCDAVYSSHTIEHFDRPGARHFLAECHRVLKPGGVLNFLRKISLPSVSARNTGAHESTAKAGAFPKSPKPMP